MRKRSGYTLIEVLIVMAILGVISGMVYPLVTEVADLASTNTMSATVRQVREKIIYQTALGIGPTSAESYPVEIDPAWFTHHRLPTDVWTNRPLKIQVVNGPKDAAYPNNKTFVLKKDGTAAGHTAWYNAANGSFCAFVPKLGSNDDQIETFERVNRLIVSEGGDDDDDDDDDDDG